MWGKCVLHYTDVKLFFLNALLRNQNIYTLDHTIITVHLASQLLVSSSYSETDPEKTRSSAIANGPCDASCQLKSCQLPSNSAETTCTTSPEQIEVMKLEGSGGPMCSKHVHSTVTCASRFHSLIGVINKPMMVDLCISPVYRRLAVAKIF